MKSKIMENIELWVIGCLLIVCVYYMLQNKENKYWRNYFKDQYFNEKDLVDKYIKKVCDECEPTTKISPNIYNEKQCKKCGKIIKDGKA